MATIIQQLSNLPPAPPNASALDASLSVLKGSISALESSIKTLEGLSAPWEHLAVAASFAVFAGIVAEVVVIVSEDRENFEDWARGIVRPPERAPRWRFWFDIVATIVVLLGVLGEAWGSSQVASINSQLRSKTSELRAKSDLLLALVTQEAGDAVTSAGKAKALANSASDNAALAKTTADAVSDEAAELDSQLKDAKSQIAQVEAERKSLQTTLENLAVCMAPRVINNWMANGKTYVDSLRPFAGYQALLTVVPEPEAIRAANNILRALHDAGWTVSIIPPPDPSRNIIQDGVTVWSYSGAGTRDRLQSFNDTKPAREAAGAVVDLLHSYNWQATLWDATSGDTDIPPKGIKIEVGLLPPTQVITSPGEKEVMDTIAAQEKRLDAETEAARMGRLREAFKNLPPKQREVQMQEAEKWHQEMKKELERFKERSGITQPCRPLSSFAPQM
jgi:hypothetical protein